MEGLIGLTKNINTTEAAMRDLSVLERMDARIQHDKDREVAAQQQEALMYERVYQMSDQLLEKDRNRINKRLQMSQRLIGDHIRNAGGSKTNFMEQGGVSIINGITNDIMRSPEAVQYQENKKNLAKILEAKEKGLGHLLSPKDIKSLEDYENNPHGGPITYSGIMAEIEIPPSENFDYGSDIPYEKVMSYNSNMVKIMGNFELVHPDKEPNMANMVAFMKEMGYGGTGSNTMKLRLDAQKAAAYAKSKKNSPTDKDKTPNSYLNQVNVLKSKIPGGLNLRTLNEEYGGDIIEYMRQNDSSIGKLYSNKSSIMSRQRNLSEKGIDITDFGIGSNENPTIFENVFNDKVGLKNSYEILPHNKYQIAERAFEMETSGLKMENGAITNFIPTEDMFRMDGVQLTGNNQLDPDDHKGNYKVLGVVTALKAKSASDDGRYNLLINAYNDDGSLDEKSTQKLDEAYGDNKKGIGGSEIKQTEVVALEGPNGDIFYKEIDISQPQIKTLFSNALAEDDDITDTVNQENRSQAEMNLYEAIDKEEKLRLTQTINAMDKEVFQEPIFEQEGQKYWGAYSGGQENRYPMMKSFYMAMDYINNSYKRTDEFPAGDQNVYAENVKRAIDANLFTQMMIHGSIEEDLKNYNQSNGEDKMISKWLNNVNDGYDENSSTAKRNEEIAKKWYQMLTMYRE